MVAEGDVGAFCRAMQLRARDGGADEAVASLRARLQAVPLSADRERLILCLAEVQGSAGHGAAMLETVISATASPSRLPPGERDLALGRLLRRHVAPDAAERRLRHALAGTPPPELEARLQLALGQVLLWRLRTEDGGTDAASSAFAALRRGVATMADAADAAELALDLEWWVETHDRCLDEDCLSVAGGLAERLPAVAGAVAWERSRIHLARGVTLELLGATEGAARAYGAILAEPADLFAEDVVVRLARLAERGGRTDLAVRRLEEALRSPRFQFRFVLYDRLARLHDEAGRHDAADALMERGATDATIRDPAALHLQRARRFGAAGNEAMERRSLRRAAAVPDSPPGLQARVALALSYDREGDRPRALQTLEGLEPSAVPPLADRLALARLFDDEGQADLARRWYATAAAPGAVPPAEGSALLRDAVARYRVLRGSASPPPPPDELLAMGEFLADGDPRTARTLLRQAAASVDPSLRSTALLTLGRIQLDSDPEAALATLRRAVASATRDELGEALFLVAQACERTGRDDEAGWHLRKAVHAPGLRSAGPAHLGLARFWLRHGEPVRALAVLRDAARLGDGELFPLLDSHRAVALDMAGDAAAARDLYLTLTHAADPRIRFHAFICLAGVAGRRGDEAETTYYLDRALETPQPWQERLVHLLRGRWAQRRGDWDTALAEIDSSLWPSWREFGAGLLLRARVLEAAGRLPEARRSYQLALVELVTRDAPLLSGEASGLGPLVVPELRAMAGPAAGEAAAVRRRLAQLPPSRSAPGPEPSEPADGVAGIQRLLRLAMDPEGPSLDAVYRAMALTFAAMGRKKESRASLRRAETFTRSVLPIDEPSPADDERREAIERLEPEELASGSRVMDITGLLGVTGSLDGPHDGRDELGEAGDEDEGDAELVKELEALVAASPFRDRSRHLFSLANALFDARRLDEAALRYGEALMDPDFEQKADARHNLGITLNELGRHERALQCFDAVIGTGSGALLASCRYHRGNALLELERFDEAARSFEDVIADDDSGLDLAVYALINLAHCRDRLGERHEAKRCLLEALGRTKQPGWIMIRLAALEANHGDMNGARLWKERAHEEFVRDRDLYGLRKLQELLKGV